MCFKEPTYNPYYALLLSHLTTTSYSHRFTLQYALWDFLRDLGQDEVGGEGTKGDVRGTSGFAAGSEESSKKGSSRVKRVAMGLGWVVSQGGVDLTVFKVSHDHCSRATQLDR
jgi:nucleolar MIF4G domain-containing protein 1